MRALTQAFLFFGYLFLALTVGAFVWRAGLGAGAGAAGAIATMGLGVKALGRCPRKTEKHGDGRRDVPLEIAGVRVEPGYWLYADADGVIVSAQALAP